MWKENITNKRKATFIGAAKIRKTVMFVASFSGGNHIELDFNKSWKGWTTDWSTGTA